jgi:hypothetical protein
MCSLVMNCKCLSRYELYECLVMKLQVLLVVTIMHVRHCICSEIDLPCTILYAAILIRANSR